MIGRRWIHMRQRVKKCGSRGVASLQRLIRVVVALDVHVRRKLHRPRIAMSGDHDLVDFVVLPVARRNRLHVPLCFRQGTWPFDEHCIRLATLCHFGHKRVAMECTIVVDGGM